MASEHGISHVKLMAVFDYHQSKYFTESEKIALRLAQGLTETPPTIDELLFDQVMAYYTTEQITGLAIAIALENFRSRFNRCFGVQPIGKYSKLNELLKAIGMPNL